MSLAPTPPLPPQRRRAILDELGATGAARVADLAQRLGVTEETIRRDLEFLQAEGLLQRTHGGAIAPGADRRELPLAVRQTTHVVEKQVIARVVAERVGEGEVVAFDSSSSALEVARQLPNIPLVVVTNGIEVLKELATRPQVQVYSTGGQLLRDSGSLVGPIAETAVRNFGITKAIVSCKGIDPRRGASEATVEHAAIKRTMLGMAEQVMLLADHSKLGVQSTSFFATPAECGTLFTDSDADQAHLAALRAAGLEIVVTPLSR